MFLHSVINGLHANHLSGSLMPCLSLRIDSHLPRGDSGTLFPIDIDGVANLEIDDEVACLLSLITGARMRSGGIVRVFEPDGDPLGVPNYFAHRPPDWSSPRFPGKRLYPSARGADITNVAKWMQKYEKLGRDDAVVLIRSARQVRDALWVSETDPELCWLLLVSALEAPASRHAIPRGMDPSDMLTKEMSALAHNVEMAGGADLLRVVAAELVPIVKATSRFLNFVDSFCPDPPKLRPLDSVRLPWGEIRKRVGQVYSYRSKRLHEARPFPKLMCNAPKEAPIVAAEVPSALVERGAASVKGAEPLPMHLHMFGYIARGCILNWWDSRAVLAK